MTWTDELGVTHAAHEPSNARSALVTARWPGRNMPRHMALKDDPKVEIRVDREVDCMACIAKGRSGWGRP